MGVQRVLGMVILVYGLGYALCLCIQAWKKKEAMREE